MRQSVWICILIFWLSGCKSSSSSIQYFQQPTLESNYHLVADTISYGDTLFLTRSKSNIPLNYFQDIYTGVCFDGKCRRVSIKLFWNVTGRYLGFELPKGEFLSKTDHEPFTPDEYERLHQLLANPELPFSTISYDELMENTDPNDPEVDGISGATSKAVAEIVVKGAAYTTYKLWTIVYGPTQSQIIDFTEQQLTTELIIRLLNSPVQTDQVWALDRIDEKSEWTLPLSAKISELIASEDFYLAYSAINAVKPGHLANEQVQIQLFSQYDKSLPSIRSLMIKKLMEAPRLSNEVINSSYHWLDKVNGKDLGDLLKLYSTHRINDERTIHEVSQLSNHENSFIANHAKRYIEEVIK